MNNSIIFFTDFFRETNPASNDANWKDEKTIAIESLVILASNVVLLLFLLFI